MPKSGTLVFSLFGEYVHPRGDDLWIGSLIKALETFDLSAQAVRSVVSRLSQRGLLRSKKVGKQSFYSITEQGEANRRRAARRAFVRKAQPWDGQWQILVYNIPEAQRDKRDELRFRLSQIGYGSLSNAVWVSPYKYQKEIDRLLTDLGVESWVRTFTASPENGDNAGLARAVWNIDEIDGRYAQFLARWKPLLEDYRRADTRERRKDDAQAFALRFKLMVDYFRVGSSDPHLPAELLPSTWSGDEAKLVFEEYHSVLGIAANRFFDSIYVGSKSKNI